MPILAKNPGAGGRGAPGLQTETEKKPAATEGKRPVLKAPLPAAGGGAVPEATYSLEQPLVHTAP